MNTLEKIKLVVNPKFHSLEDELSPYWEVVAQINDFHQKLETVSDLHLQSFSEDLRLKCRQGISSESLLVEAFALIKEAFVRKLGLKPYDIQIVAAIGLHYSKMVEMQTGEGKTLAAVFPAFLNALSGKGVHVLTFNDYLAKRDAEWMGPVFRFLGLTVAYCQQDMPLAEKTTAYQADITYATAKTVGFDYLRSFIAYQKEEIILRPFHFAIIDEADAILIDEARNPLVLAGNFEHSNLDFNKIARVVDSLTTGVDFERDNQRTQLYLTESGVQKLEHFFGVEELQSGKNLELYSVINLALQAREFLRKDIDYIIKEGEIKLIDEFTGRVVEDRRWHNGLQTAVEAKEGVSIQSEGAVLNAITLQHLIQTYPKIAAMTATAQASAEEFYEFYGFKTLVLPPHVPCRRIDHPDRIFASLAAKNKALLKEINLVHRTGQPILIGTLNVKESEELAEKIRQKGIPCQVLNAKNDEAEAKIIAKAGSLGAVTIATNMAGRGTDIRLGGPDQVDREKVLRVGGLYVIGTNRHESTRIDQQLRGRAGRQGDIGSSRFFISFEDELMVKYGLKALLPKKYRSINSKEAITNKKILRFINITQRIIEYRFFDLRKMLYQYSSIIEKQRQIIQAERQAILEDVRSLIQGDLTGLHRSNPKKLSLAQKWLLYQYDRAWAEHLDILSQLREGIHFVRLGGENPLRNFRKRASEKFELLEEFLQDKATDALFMLETGTVEKLEEEVEPPTSTWTYIINDNPFSDQLSIMLADHSNIGMQVDFISSFALFVVGLYRKWKR